MTKSRVKQVTCVVLTVKGNNFTVKAEGIVATSGWSEPALVVADNMPDDRVIDLLFVAKPPSGPSLQVLSGISASTTVEDAGNYDCVIVHAFENQQMSCFGPRIPEPIISPPVASQ